MPIILSILALLLVLLFFIKRPYCKESKRYYNRYISYTVEAFVSDKYFEKLEEVLASKQSRAFSDLQKKLYKKPDFYGSYYQCFVYKCDSSKKAFLSFKYYKYTSTRNGFSNYSWTLKKPIIFDIDYEMANKLASKSKRCFFVPLLRSRSAFKMKL